MKNNIISFKDFETTDSKFHAELNPRGGSITFSNSGIRGKKYFNLSIDSFLQCLKDIKENIISFKPHFNYVEKEWRELGQKYFTDWASLAQIGVQTKPMFSTLSKLIMWANNISLNEIDPETTMRIDENTINQTIDKLNNLADLYTPDFKENKTMTTETIDWKPKFIKWFIEREQKGGRSNYFKGTFGSDSGKFKEALEYYGELYYDDFNSELFKFSKNKISEKIKEIKENIFKESTALFQHSKKTSNHMPRAILGEKNYLEFLNEQKKTLEQIDFEIGHYRKLPKPFLLLAGISGTGKTRFIREQADEDNYEIVPVRPDWHEPSDLLGYITRLTENEKYVVTDVLVFIVKAWRAILEAGLTFEGSKVSGDISDIQKIRPYWLCLDEMNLAPVEQYFADYLSISETQEWKHEDGLLTYSCDSLLSSDLIKSVDEGKLKEALKLVNDDISEQLWQHFVEHGISIPFNLIVAGTVNMDETTHGFSRKVIDRALSFDFGEFYPNDFQKFFETDIENHKLTFPVWTDGRNLNALSQTFDGDGKKTISFLESINEILDDTPFKLAYRALNEVLLSVITNAPQTQIELCAVWDDFIMCKLLPRIEGDLDKLSSRNESDSLLMDLFEVLKKEFETIWDGENRPDLYRKYTEEKEHPVGAPTEDSPSQVIWISCRSKKKLVWMQDRLIRDTFTSFWP